MTEHLDADALADLDEGLLDRDHMASARAHVAGCPQCRAELAALTGVRERLAAAAEVEPMPAEVVARLDRALAEVATEPASTAVTRSVIPLRRAAALRAPRAALAAGRRRGRAGPGRRCRRRLGAARLRQQRRRHQLGQLGRQGRPAQPRPTAATRSPPAVGTGPRSRVTGRGAAAAGRHAGPHPAAEQLLRPGRRERVGRGPRASSRACRRPGWPAGRRWPTA